MPDRVALITGVTGQDGALLAQLLLAKGYAVHGIKRRSSTGNTGRLAGLDVDARQPGARFFLHEGDLGDAASLIRLIHDVEPAEIYNLAAQSDVGVSFDTPEYTADCDALGALRLLEALRILRRTESVRFYQASTSELFGNAPTVPQNEKTVFRPRNPYGVAKLYAYWITVSYRETYGLHASNGILFNHEGPTRGEAFVTRKIARTVASIVHGLEDRIRLGNLDARRDWGDARDYVEGMWRIVNHERADDYVLATGVSHSVREFVELAFAEAGISIVWEGRGVDERGRDASTGAVRVEVDPRYFRPAEVDELVGDASKARAQLGWRPRSTFRELVAAMVRADLEAVAAARRNGAAARDG